MVKSRHEKKIIRLSRWHSWFAWKPVKTSDCATVWLSKVDRKGKYHVFGSINPCWVWQYAEHKSRTWKNTLSDVHAMQAQAGMGQQQVQQQAQQRCPTNISLDDRNKISKIKAAIYLKNKAVIENYNECMEYLKGDSELSIGDKKRLNELWKVYKNVSK